MSTPAPKLDLVALFATKAFDEDDLAHNRRGVLSPAQEAWRAAHPKFVVSEESGADVEMVVGRVTIEGRYALGPMGETRFAQLAIPGRRFSLRRGLDRRLPRDAPYRAYVAYEWVWSIEPATEEELFAAGAVATYRHATKAASVPEIARALQDSLSTELAFDDADLAENCEGRLSPAQRALGLKKLVFGVVSLVVATVMWGGFVVLLQSGAPLPVVAPIVGIAALGFAWLSSVRAMLVGLAWVTASKPTCVVARLDNDPTNRDRLVFETKEESIKIPRVAVTITEAPFSEVRMWKFELYLVPRTQTVLSVRAVAPPEEQGQDR